MMANIYRCSACPAWFEESEKSGVYRDGEGNNYLTCPECRSNFQKFDFSVKEEIVEDKINEQKRLSGEISEEKDFIIDRLKDEKDGFYQENESLKKEIEEHVRRKETLEEEIKRLQDNEILLDENISSIRENNFKLLKRLKKKDNILKIIKGLVYSIANLLEV